MKIYTVYDSKVEAYMKPFFARNKGDAMRGFMEACADPQHQFYKYPGDFTLLEMGDFDDLTGKIVPYVSLISLGNGLEFKTAVEQEKNIRSVGA